MMTPERWAEIQTHLENVWELTTQERPAYLQKCGHEHPELYQELVSLLGYQQADAVSEIYNQFWAQVGEPQWQSGDLIGDYKLERLLGEGGMGRVYLAKRVIDGVEQRVALKVIRHQNNQQDITDRFKSERQILAHLQHPNIAQFLDAGTTHNGHPFFVMEYIEGKPITDYCNDHSLKIADRLRVFEQVCAAVQYAHQNLVVHRDLKPNNIWVTKEGTVKLLDFGIAKVLQTEINPISFDRTLTQTIHAFTPSYASPEQLKGESVTTASDIYMLGVVLYELLTGHRPYATEEKALHVWTKIVLEQEPRRLQTVIDQTRLLKKSDGQLLTVSARQVSEWTDTPLWVLRRQLGGDLSTIVLKLLRKEPRRRYESAAQLAEDLKRFLKGLPVMAQPDSFRYRTRKFISRHQWGVGVSTIIAVVGIGLGWMMYYQNTQISQERDIANRERDKAKEVSDFFLDMFNTKGVNDSLTVRAFLLQQEKKAFSRLDKQADVQATTLLLLGRLNRELGLFSRAKVLIEQSYAKRQSLFGKNAETTIEARIELMRLYQDLGANKRAEKEARDALSQYREGKKENESLITNLEHELASSLLAQNNIKDWKEAEILVGKVLTWRKKHFLDDRKGIVAALGNLSKLQYRQRQFKDEEVSARQTYILAQEAYEKGSPQIAVAMMDIAVALMAQGQQENNPVKSNEALTWLQNSINLYGETLGKRNIFLVQPYYFGGQVYLSLNRYAEAEIAFQKSIDIANSAEADLPLMKSLYEKLGTSFLKQGKKKEGLEAWQKSVELFMADKDAGEELEGRIEMVLAVAQQKQQSGQADEAKRILRECAAILPSGSRDRYALEQALDQMMVK